MTAGISCIVPRLPIGLESAFWRSHFVTATVIPGRSVTVRGCRSRSSSTLLTVPTKSGISSAYTGSRPTSSPRRSRFFWMLLGSLNV